MQFTQLSTYRLNGALVIREEIVPTPPAGSVIERTLKTSIDTTLSPKLQASEEVLQYGRNAESRVKRIVKRKLASRSRRPPTDGWRLIDTNFYKLQTLYKFTVEGCCEAFGFNGHINLLFF